LRLWNSIHKEKKQQRIAKVFSFPKYNKFQNRIRLFMPIAHGLENLAPTLANKGPNIEYPWPHESLPHAPVNHDFAEWKMLETPRGRDLLRVIRIATEKFPKYADLYFLMFQSHQSRPCISCQLHQCQERDRMVHRHQI